MYEDLSPHLPKAHQESVREGIRGDLPEAHGAEADVLPSDSVLCPWVGWPSAWTQKVRNRERHPAETQLRLRAQPRVQSTQGIHRGPWHVCEETARRQTPMVRECTGVYTGGWEVDPEFLPVPVGRGPAGSA